MYLDRLYLHHFRNYEEGCFEFDSKCNLIYGANAQGKTTLLEAIHYLMLGRSFRPSHSVELIKHNASSFYLEGIFFKHEIEQRLRIYFDGKERQMIHNQSLLPTISSLLGLIHGVVLTPDDVHLIKGSPQHRRQFLDTQIAQAHPLYVHHFTRYTRAMRQRNQLLKAKQSLTMESWEHEMSQSAAYLILQRQQTVDQLQKHCAVLHPLLTGEKVPLQITYKTFPFKEWTLDHIRSTLLEEFKRNRFREMGLGYTVTGPHKDDLLITIGEKDVRYFASEGQQRSCVTTLHFAEWHLLKEETTVPPLLMIDDVGMGLDAQRQERLLEQLQSVGQVFLTTTNENLLRSLSHNYRAFRIHEGRADSGAAA